MLLHEIEPNSIKSGQIRAVFFTLSNVIAKTSNQVLKIAIIIVFFCHVVFLQLVDGVATATLEAYVVAFYFGGAV